MALKEKISEVIETLIGGKFKLPSRKDMYFYIFLIFILFMYITNHLSVESDLRRISDLKSEIKELRNESISTSSELMNMSKQSEVLRRVETEGLNLKELTEPPRILKVD